VVVDGEEIPVESLKDIVSIKANAYSLYAVAKDGTVYRGNPSGEMVNMDGQVVGKVDGEFDDFSGPRPGIHVHGMARLEQGNELRFVITGKTWNSTISFDANIPVILGGTLELAFAPDVDPASWAGRSLQLFDWTGVTLSGRFDTVSQGNLTWDTSQLYTTGFVTLVPEPAPAALLALGGLALLRRHRHSTLWPN
jgi:hypothetical protein